MSKAASRKLKQVRVTAGPQWTLGRVGWLDEETRHVYFEPRDNNPEPTAETSFWGAYPSLTLTTRPLNAKEKEHVQKVETGSNPKAPGAFR